MSVMKYKDPSTGEVKKVFAPTFDAYTKTETYSKTESDTLLNGKAPAGYGSFGETLEHFDLADSDGTLLKAKLIEIANTIGANNTYRFTFSAYPFVTGWPYFATVSTMTNDNGEKRISLEASSVVGYGFRLYYMEHSDHIGGEWSDVIWYDPPMKPNQIYCTYERSSDKLVYKKMDSNGVIWWSTDQSTWKREAERVGAMPKLNCGKLLDGIPNMNDANHRISSAGWYRILRTVGNESYLIQLGHGYNAHGPEDMLFKVCVDRYCPSIVVLSNSIYKDSKFYTKIRITYDDRYSYVDFYYANNGANAVESTIWAFDKNWAGVRAEPLLLSKVDDTPSGETILLTQDVSVISSGNVLTVGADNILPLSKGGTGSNNVQNARANLGIDKIVSCPAGSSISLTLPHDSMCLIGASDNVRTNGLILVHTNSVKGQANVGRVTQLSSPVSWSYSINSGVLTLSETDGRYAVDFSVVTLCSGSGEVYS